MNVEVLEVITTLAQQTDVLIFGEVHGTQEVPQFIGDHLEMLQPFGYGALGLEIPHTEQESLWRWAIGEVQELPQFFRHPLGDGRGNAQVLALIQKAVNLNWWVFCFDAGFAHSWQERDRKMAENLLTEWARTCPGKKVICICGNLHSRISVPSRTHDPYWPSFAANLQLLRPDLIVNSINIVFHQGTFFNLKVQKFHGEPITDAYITHDIHHDEHTLSLHLPRATPVTHLGEPIRFGFVAQLLLFAQRIVVLWMNRLKSK